VRRYTSREEDASAGALFFHLPACCLRAEERAGEIDVVRPTPFVGRHVERGRAAHDAGEAAEDVYGAEDGGGGLEGAGDGFLIAHVDGFGDDAARGELGVELSDGGEGGVGVEVPEGEAGGAVLEEGAGGFKGEGSGATGYC